MGDGEPWCTPLSRKPGTNDLSYKNPEHLNSLRPPLVRGYYVLEAAFLMSFGERDQEPSW